jgi:RNA polymerase sigma factor (sigma-70 family)
MPTLRLIPAPAPAPKRAPLTSAQQELCARYLPLAEGLARPLERAWPSACGDFESAASLALVEAARTFDPGRGVAFGTFARFRINGALADTKRQLGSRRDAPGDVAGVADHRVLDPAEVAGVSDLAGAALARLDARTAAVVKAVVLDGMTHRQAARTLGRSKTRVTAALAGALGTLRCELAAAA